LSQNSKRIVLSALLILGNVIIVVLQSNSKVDLKLLADFAKK
jgi:hypothetical protein